MRISPRREENAKLIIQGDEGESGKRTKMGIKLFKRNMFTTGNTDATGGTRCNLK